jgi:hypothetical protein
MARVGYIGLCRLRLGLDGGEAAWKPFGFVTAILHCMRGVGALEDYGDMHTLANITDM